MGPSSGAAAKRGLRLGGLIVVLVGLAILGGLAVWGIRVGFEIARRASCANILGEIGEAMQTYASDHKQAWPDIFTEESTRWDRVGNTRTDEWDPVTSKGNPPKSKPGDNGETIQSNTANLWFLIAQMGLTPTVFVCPSTDHKPDDVTWDYAAVRDFRGETFVSYSFQNVLGEYRLTSTITSGEGSSMAVAADVNPMRRDFWSGAPGGGKKDGVTDRELARKPQFLGEEVYIAAWNKEAGGVAGAWELGSPNHGFKGQNVLYLDGHVAWATHPYVGPNWDNIWIARKPEDGWEIDENKIGTLRHSNDPASYNGRFTLPADSKGDSFLVP